MRVRPDWPSGRVPRLRRPLRSSRSRPADRQAQVKIRALRTFASPNSRYQLTPHLPPVGLIARQAGGEEFLLVEDAPDERRHHRRERQQAPSRAERDGDPPSSPAPRHTSDDAPACRGG